MNLKSKGNSFISSFIYAVNGIISSLKNEKNLRVHALIMVAVIGFGWYYRINYYEWLIIIITIIVVITTELINTAIEATVDLVTDKYHKKAEIAKDIAAGAVLFSAAGAVVIGLIVFAPKIF